MNSQRDLTIVAPDPESNSTPNPQQQIAIWHQTVLQRKKFKKTNIHFFLRNEGFTTTFWLEAWFSLKLPSVLVQLFHT